MFSSIQSLFLTMPDRDLYMIIALCCAFALLLREFIPSFLVSLALIPFLILGSVVALFALRKGGVMIDAGNDGQIVIATGLGVTVTFLVLAIIFDVILGVTDWRVRSMMKRRFGKS